MRSLRSRMRFLGSPAPVLSATQALFADVPGSGLPPHYACKQFPDEASAIDSFWLGLICFAVTYPVSTTAERLFIMAYEPEGKENQLSWPLWMQLLLGAQDWRFEARPSPAHVAHWISSDLADRIVPHLPASPRSLACLG